MTDAKLPGFVERDVDLASRNTLALPGRAAYYAEIHSTSQLATLAEVAGQLPPRRFVLGGGSNLLLTGDYDGLVLQMAIPGRELAGEDSEAWYVRVGAGENWNEFVDWTLDQGWPGLENLALIPGSVGAAPVQNIGAYGAEVRDCLHSLTLFDFETGSIRRFTSAECTFGYRDSVFKRQLKNRAVILDVTFALPKRWQPNTGYSDVATELAARGIATPTPRQLCDAIVAIRQRKLPDPARLGNAGSFFKNPVVSAAQKQALAARFPQLVSYQQQDGSHKLAAGWLVDQAGWKGKVEGRAGVSETQALVLVNRGGANGKEIAQLAQAIAADVQAKFGVALEAEPLIL